MIEYELFYLIAESKEIDMARIKEEVKAIVTAEGGAYNGEEKLEKRKLAYAVKREIRGTYIAQRFTTADRNDREASIEAGEQSVIARIDHKLTLYRDVLRFMIVRAEGLPALTPEEAASSVVAEVAKEAQVQKAAVEKKAVRRVRDEAVAEAPKKEAAEVVEKELKKEKKAEASETNEAELDKKLEEVLNI